MDFGIAVATSTESWKVVKRAEELGFSHAWFYDTQLLNPDVFIGMALAAANTSKIRLGTGVLIPSNRIAPVTANAFASLNKLAPGRIDFGVGTGFTGRRTMGMKAIKLSDMKEYIRIVQALLNEETVSWELENEEHKIRFLNPDLGLINTKDPVPLHISAMGPKARRLTAELGGGWLNFSGTLEGATKDLEDMQAAWAESQRPVEALYSTCFGLGCVLKSGETADSQRARAQAGTWVAVFFHNLVESFDDATLAHILPPARAELVKRYRAEVYDKYDADTKYLSLHRGHLMFIRPEEEPFIQSKEIEELTWTGTVSELQERLRGLRDAGYQQFTIQLVEGQEDAVEDWAEVMAGI
ncbi:MAG: LLM class flavin-dependent oxidoreductase [Pseudomonadota bacterium]